MSTNAVDWKALEELHEKATGGEWSLSDGWAPFPSMVDTQNIYGPAGVVAKVVMASQDGKYTDERAAVAKLIPALHNAFPAILAERAALIAERDRWEDKANELAISEVGKMQQLNEALAERDAARDALREIAILDQEVRPPTEKGEYNWHWRSMRQERIARTSLSDPLAAALLEEQEGTNE